MKDRNQALIDLYFQGRANDEEVAALEQRMLENPDLRQQYLEQAMTEAELRSFALREDKVVEMPSSVSAMTPEPKNRRVLTTLIGAAAAAAVFAIVSLTNTQPATVGSILSSELAGWQSDQPTIEGAEFGPGTYMLQTGVAILGFHSGAEMVLEGPARFEVVSEMHVIFDFGNASFHVPESAVGFQVDTSYGKVVDHGTRFSLSLGQDDEEARLVVLEGEVAIHHSGGEVKHLFTDETVRMNQRNLLSDSDLTAEGGLEAREPVITLGTGGRETSVIHNNQRDTRLSPDFLMVKLQKESPHVNRRALLAFDLSGVNLDQIAESRLILNAVPTKLGMVTDMPKVSEFGLYGLPDDDRENWPTSGLQWDDAPKVEEATQLATFPMHRAAQRAVIKLDTPELLAFLKSDRTGQVSFMIRCLTPGTTLVHGFASSQHREAAGPVLELALKDR
ncbi:MAG: FecR domain-containing protein [Opitutaceae bacterium]|nr:FecR domain-containing protein [Opitutaceae bacterium]